jgi:hypothetical protein
MLHTKTHLIYTVFFHIERKIQAEGVLEQGTIDDVWTSVRERQRRTQRSAQGETA